PQTQRMPTSLHRSQVAVYEGGSRSDKYSRLGALRGLGGSMFARYACGRAIRGTILSTLLILGWSMSRAQTTVWVDDCAGTGTGTQGDPYCKIQTAICAIKASGGRINVLPGTYHEAIRVTADIQIVSTDGPATTILDATGRPCVNPDYCTYQSTTNCSA